MPITLTKPDIKKLTSVINTSRKFNCSIAVDTNYDYDLNKYITRSYATNLDFENLEQTSKFLAISKNAPIGSNSGLSSKGVTKLGNKQTGESIYSDATVKAAKESCPRLRFVCQYLIDAKVVMPLQVPPVEETVKGVTYRRVTRYIRASYSGSADILLCEPHTAPIYDYLDAGNLLVSIVTKNEEYKYILCTSFDYDHNLISILCKLDSLLLKKLTKGFLVEDKKAKMTRISMEKALNKKLKKEYREIKKVVDIEYLKNSNLVVANKLSNGEVQAATFNNCRITQTSATYDAVSITANDLLTRIKGVDFAGEFDIYGLINSFASDVAETINAATGAVSYSFNINGIDITAEQDAKYIRKINGVRIRADELATCIYRASCHKTLDNYNAFLTSVRKMSLRYHDALGNGLRVKIHNKITSDEYRDANPSINAPKITFRKIKNHYYIEAGIDFIKVDLNKAINGIKNLNRLTNNRYIRNDYEYRNTQWAVKELNKLISKLTKEHIGSFEDEDGVIQAFTPEQTAERAAARKAALEALAAAAKLKEEEAIKRSEELLAEVIKEVKAEAVWFKDEDGWKITGKLNNYVVTKTGRVFNADTEAYICIVDSNREHGIGMDGVVSRMLALRNDAVAVDRISTIPKAKANVVS